MAFEPVTLIFRLPPALQLMAGPGRWRHASADVTITIAADGAVEVSCADALETHARHQVLNETMRFLRILSRQAPALAIPAALTAPSQGGRPDHYAISIGARVSIARTREEPALLGPEGPKAKLVAVR
jgi:hypothetical protein